MKEVEITITYTGTNYRVMKGDKLAGVSLTYQGLISDLNRLQQNGCIQDRLNLSIDLRAQAVLGDVKIKFLESIVDFANCLKELSN